MRCASSAFDPFKHHRPDELTAGALREIAGRQGVDVSVKSSGGAAPLAPERSGREPPGYRGDVQEQEGCVTPR